MSKKEDEYDEKVFAAFHPYYAQKITEVKPSIEARKTSFVHYTSSGNLLNVIRGKQFWMRNASIMNDYSEIQYGIELLATCYRGDPGNRLKGILRKNFGSNEIAEKLEHYYNGWLKSHMDETYIVSICEHDQTEDNYGRLSMWRAYAPNSGVALVLNGSVFTKPSDALGANTYPVLYADQKKFNSIFDQLVTGLEEIAPSFEEGNITDSDVLAELLSAFREFIVTTKHPGFSEEREWRVIYNPQYQHSRYITESIECVGSVPQKIQSIPLDTFSSENDDNAEFTIDARIPNLFQRIIVGPSETPEVIKGALAHELEKAEVTDVYEKIVISDIPLRV